MKSGLAKDAFKAQLLMTLASTSALPVHSEDGNAMGTSMDSANLSSDIQSSSSEGTSVPAAESGSSSSASTSHALPLQASSESPAVASSSAPTSNENPLIRNPGLNAPASRRTAVENLLAERRHRLDVHKQQTDDAEKADRKAKADARKEAMTAAPDSAKAKQATYAQQQRKRNYEAKLERDRILRQIEQDRSDRREKEAQRRNLIRAEGENGKPSKSKESEPFGNGNGLTPERMGSSSVDASTITDPISGKSKECPIQVRLFDGTMLRNRFLPHQTLAEIRAWVDSQKSDDMPYTFKQILSPLPNRSLTISEEEAAIVQLGFVPSATLVTVPIRSYTAAYSDVGQGLLSRGISLGYGTAAAGASIVANTLGTFLGIGQARSSDEATSAASEQTKPDVKPNGSRAAINIRTLRDQREKQDEHQLYNGNHVSPGTLLASGDHELIRQKVNVQPRRDGNDKDD